MRPLIVLLAAAAAALTLAAPVVAAPPAPAPVSLWDGIRAAKPTVTPGDVWKARVATWKCQDRAGLERTKASRSPRHLAKAGVPYRAWIVSKWAGTLQRCKLILASTLPAPGSWLAAVDVVQGPFPGTRDWIRSCSSARSEGGWGRWVPNSRGSGAGGWMQYMESTFWTDFRAAVQHVTERGWRVPRSAWSWYSPLGQALAAGWAHGHARPAGKWTGYGC